MKRGGGLHEERLWVARFIVLSSSRKRVREWSVSTRKSEGCSKVGVGFVNHMADWLVG